MENIQIQVQNAIIEQIEIIGSQNQVAKQLGISGAQVVNIRTGIFERVSKEMLNKIAAALGISHDGCQTAETLNYKRIMNICEHAKENSVSRAISFAPGTGKTHTLRLFSRQNRDVFYVECEEYFTKRVFLQEICTAMGIKHAGYGIPEMVTLVIKFLNAKNHPLLIIDEADKLKNHILNLYKTFYNKCLSSQVII